MLTSTPLQTRHRSTGREGTAQNPNMGRGDADTCAIMPHKRGGGRGPPGRGFNGMVVGKGDVLSSKGCVPTCCSCHCFRAVLSLSVATCFCKEAKERNKVRRRVFVVGFWEVASEPSPACLPFPSSLPDLLSHQPGSPWPGALPGLPGAAPASSGPPPSWARPGSGHL